MTDDVFKTKGPYWLRQRQGRANQHVAQPLVRTRRMIIGKPPFEQKPQVLLAEDDELIQDFMFCSLHPTFREEIQVWTQRRDGLEFDAVVLEDRAELLGELAVSIADDVCRPVLIRLVVKDHGHVPCLLSHPHAIGVGRHAGDVDATWVDVDEEQDLVDDRPAERPISESA